MKKIIFIMKTDSKSGEWVLHEARDTEMISRWIYESNAGAVSQMAVHQQSASVCLKDVVGPH